MKYNRTLEELKKIIIPIIIYLIIGLATIFLIEKSVAITIIIEVVNYLFFLFFLYIKLKNYKLKYFFLGKKYKEEMKIYLRYFKEDSALKKIFTKKWSKEIFRKNGTLFATEIKTPFSDMWDRYDLWLSYENEDDDIFVFFVIYDYLNSCGSLYRIFEQLTHYFTYEKYRQIIESSPLYPQDMKEVLLDSSFEKAYCAIRREEIESDYKRTEEDDKILSYFDENQSQNLNKYLEEFNKIFEETAINLYLAEYKFFGLHENTKEVLFSADCKKRLSFVCDENSENCRIFEEKFEFDDPENQFHSRGFWMPTNKSFGIYASLELAKNDILKEQNEYETAQQI